MGSDGLLSLGAVEREVSEDDAAPSTLLGRKSIGYTGQR